MNIKLFCVRIIYLLKVYFQNKHSSQEVHNKDWEKINTLSKHNFNSAFSLSKEEDTAIWFKEKVNHATLIVNLKNFFGHDLNNFTLIDIGSGAGRFVSYNLKIFKKILSVEPSLEGYSFQKNAFALNSNVFLYNMYAEDFFQQINLQNENLLIYTNAVLHHIKDNAVKKILDKINNLPNKTYLLFNESYTSDNSRLKYWLGHVRPKKYYIDSLNNYDLKFFEHYNDSIKKEINSNIRGGFIAIKKIR